MPVAPTYPGVYVEEIPSGVRTIVGVATSITAFLGRAVRGPVNEPRSVFNYSDFERLFGGLHVDYPMSYAVRDFFLNGGTEAIIVRLYQEKPTATGAGGAGMAPDLARATASAAAKAILNKVRAKSELSKALNELTTEGDAQLASLPKELDAQEAQIQAQVNYDDAVSAAARAQTKLNDAQDAKKQLEEVLKESTIPDLIEPVQNSLVAAQAAVDQAKTAVTNVNLQAALDTLKQRQQELITVQRQTQAVRMIIDAVRERTNDAAMSGTFEPSKLPKDNAAEIAAFVDQALAGLPAPGTADGFAAVPAGNLTFKARSQGIWANTLQVKVDSNIDETLAERYAPAKKADLRNLSIVDTHQPNINLETFAAVSLNSQDIRYIVNVIEQQSSLIRVVPPSSGTATLPVSQAFNLTGGVDSDFLNETSYSNGLKQLYKVDLFNLLCIPPDKRGTNADDTNPQVYAEALRLCVQRRAMLIVDPPASWKDADTLISNASTSLSNNIKLPGPEARNAALFYPRVRQADPQRENQIDTFVPCGIVAGIMAKTDASRGVWKAPAGIDAGILGVNSLEVTLTDEQNGTLNPLGINCLRSFPVYGTVIWGARTLRGADQLADEYKYIPVRRLALYIEESLYRSLKWVVFEPNDEPLWSQIRLNVGAFMNNLFRQGAFQGQTPREAYFVKCDKETTTQNDINLGIVNIVVGFAPLKPAEFVIVKIQQMAGQIAV